MHKKILSCISAFAIAFSMALTSGISVYATEPEGQIVGETATATEPEGQAVGETATTTEPEAKTDTVTATSGAVVVESITVDSGKSAVDASGNGTSVTVNEDVTTSGYNNDEYHTYKDELGKEYHRSDIAVHAWEGATVEVNGKVNANADEQTGVNAFNGATVTVGGGISATDAGINAAQSSNVTVKDGNVSGARSGVNATSDSTVTVNGDVTSYGIHTVYSSDWDNEKKEYKTKKEGITGEAIYTDGTSDIYIDGDVIGISNGIGIFSGLSTGNIDGNIVVNGTVAASQGPSIVLGDFWTNKDGYDDNGYKKTPEYKNIDEVVKSVPQITVYALDSDISVGRPVTDPSVTHDDVVQAVRESINFIISQDEKSVKNYGLKLSDDKIKSIDAGSIGKFNTVNINQAFKVAAELPEGYTINAGSNVKVVENGDGTFTLTLLNVKGGINIEAVLRPVPAPAPKESESSTNNNAEPQYEVVVQEVTPAYADPNQAPAGAIVIANTVAETAPANVAAISGDKPARTVSYSIANITPIQYKNSIIENVAAAPAGGAFNIETDRVACFDTKMIEAIEARPDIDVNVVFTYGGKKLKVTIPAGYNVRSLLDASGYCGFLKLLAVLGATEL
jgi:hypothetical protein